MWFGIANLRSNRKVLAVLLAVVVIVASVLIIQRTALSDGDDELKALISYDRQCVWYEEPINFSASASRGAITEYSWDFGYGATSDEKSPAHVYETTGWHNVTLTVRDGEGRENTTVATVGVQFRSDEFTITRGRIIDVRRVSSTPLGGGMQFGPYVSSPSIDVDVLATDTTGSFEFEVELRWSDTDDPNLLYVQTVHTSMHTTFRQDIQESIHIAPEDIPEECMFVYSMVMYMLNPVAGTWSGATGTITMAFELPEE